MKRFLIVTATGEEYLRAEQLSYEVKSELSNLGHMAHLVSDVDVPVYKPDLVIAIGGDGTIMRAMKKYSAYGIPTFGINGGDLGFLASAEVDNWQSALPRLIAGDYEREERLALQFQIGVNGPVVGPIVNEMYLFHPQVPVTYEARINGHVLWGRLAARGLLLSTATGSNAQSFSNHGQPLFPTSQDVVLTPMNPQMANVRAFSFPEVARGGSVSISLLRGKRGNEAVEVWADGTQYTTTEHPLHIGEPVIITKAPQPLLLATFGLAHFFAALKAKKGYGP
jgi:NAD+ kinase